MLSRFSLVALTLGLALGCNNTPAGNDAAAPGNDASGGASDAGHDAASPVDVGPLPDTGPVICEDGYAGCTAATAMDMTGMSGPIAITVTGSGTATPRYSPSCVRVSAGTMVTIENSAIHPLRPATCSPSDTPITGAAGTSSFTFANAGRYGYWCGNHGADNGTGMAGLIIVE
jgi:plastocyanin